jgi:hypothetical protein
MLSIVFCIRSVSKVDNPNSLYTLSQLKWRFLDRINIFTYAKVLKLC